MYKLTLTPQHSIDFTLGEVGEGVGQLRVGVEDVIWGWQNKVPNYTDSSSCHGILLHLYIYIYHMYVQRNGDGVSYTYIGLAAWS